MTGRMHAMAWILRRLLIALPVVAGITVLTFTLIHLAPGDPIYLLAGDSGSAAYYAEMRAKYGLDRSLTEQFLRYAGALARGDFGYSFMYQRPVLGLLADHLLSSFLLGFTALFLATAGGFGAALLAVASGSRLLDRLLRAGASLAYAAPVFWTGQIFVLIAAVQLGLLPVGGISSARESLTGTAYALDVARHLILPALTLSLPFGAVVARVSRAGLLEGLRDPYVRAAYARGLTRRRILTRHVARNAFIPLAALVGEHAAQIVASAALTEALFGWPGVGYLVLHASLHRDYPLVIAAFIGIATSVVFFNALADAAAAGLDPRVRLS